MTPWQYKPGGPSTPIRDPGGMTAWGRNLPPWLNRVSHSLNILSVGVVVAEILIDISKGTSFWKSSGHLTGAIMGTAGIYSVAVIVYLAKKRLAGQNVAQSAQTPLDLP